MGFEIKAIQGKYFFSLWHDNYIMWDGWAYLISVFQSFICKTVLKTNRYMFAFYMIPWHQPDAGFQNVPSMFKRMQNMLSIVNDTFGPFHEVYGCICTSLWYHHHIDEMVSLPHHLYYGNPYAWKGSLDFQMGCWWCKDIKLIWAVHTLCFQCLIVYK